MAYQKTSTPKLRFVTLSSNEISASWTYYKEHLKEFSYKWTYTTGNQQKGKDIWYEGGSGTVAKTTKKNKNAGVIFTAPENARYVKFYVKPVSTEHTVTVTNKKGKKEKKTQPYWKGQNVSNKIKVWERGYPDPPSVSAEVIKKSDGFYIRSIADSIDEDDTTHLEFYLVRPSQKDVGVDGQPTVRGSKGWKSGLIDIYKKTETDKAGWDIRVSKDNLGFGFQVKVRAVNSKLRVGGNPVHSEWSQYYPLMPQLLYTPPKAPTGVSAIKTKSNNQQDQMKVSWKAATGADQYEVQYTTDSHGWGNESMTSSVTTPLGGNTSIYIDVQAGNTYWVRVRSINTKVTSGDNFGDWSGTVKVIVGTRPSPPTTWSSRLTVRKGDDVLLFFTHNTTDGSAMTQAQVRWTISTAFGSPINIPLKTDPDLGYINPQGSYIFKTSNIPDQAKVRWQIRTRGLITDGVNDGWSDWSTTREFTVFEPPTLLVQLSDTPTLSGGDDLEVVSEFPFYILAQAGPSTQRAIGFYVSIAPTNAYRTVGPDGVEKWVNAGEEVYSQYFDFEPTANLTDKLEFKDDNGVVYATIVDNNLTLTMDPSRVTLVNEPGVSYTVSASVSMNSGLSANDDDQFDMNLTSLNFGPDGTVTVDEDGLSCTILPSCMTTFVWENDIDYDEIYGPDWEPPADTVAPDVSLAVYRYNANGTFTLVGDDIPSESPVSVTDPHMPLRHAIYRVVATSKKTGQIVYEDLDPVDLDESGIVIQWDEVFTGIMTEDVFNDEGVLISQTEPIEPTWTGGIVILPANIDISNTTNPDRELAKYDGRTAPVDYHGTQLNETGSWTAQFPKSDTNIISALRRLQAYQGKVYVREPSGLGYWAVVTIDMPINHLDLVVTATISITRVEGGL